LPAEGWLKGGDGSKIKPAKIIHYLKEKNCRPPLINKPRSNPFGMLRGKNFCGFVRQRRTGPVGGNPRSGFLPARQRRAGSQSASGFCW